ncbi:CobW family GTP-binding protein [Mangrovicella endophytica]|uniref:CobW family GTP-binding protein n=1 Tax=Mangrovicella endophytica TaxID=2066697 RepID=UPI001FDF4351|nr:GTP-binding protein [Mangrovicella endophytica]
MAPEDAIRPAPMALTVLTGCLGAGKTTLLNRLLSDPGVTDTAVIVNEFGAVGIDHLLVESAAGETIVELSDGCLCCSVRGELADTLVELAERVRHGTLKPLKRVVVETTGLADPTPILAMLMTHPALLSAYALDGVVTVVDALAGAANLKNRPEAARQIAVADRLVLTKTDLAPPDATMALKRSLADLNPRAPILSVAAGEAEPAALFGSGLVDPATGLADVSRWLDAAGVQAAGAGQGHGHDGHGHDDHDHHHHHGHDHAHDGAGADAGARQSASHRHGGVASFSIVSDKPISRAALDGFLDLLMVTCGDGLLRMKAVLAIVEDPDRPLAVHAVRSFLHPPVRLPAWPAATVPSCRLVVIGEGLDEGAIRDLFAAFAGEPRTDRPDRAALSDNPLAVAGYSFG